MFPWLMVCNTNTVIGYVIHLRNAMQEDDYSLGTIQLNMQ